MLQECKSLNPRNHNDQRHLRSLKFNSWFNVLRGTQMTLIFMMFKIEFN